MRFAFQKLDGLGNDFVMIDNMDGSIELSPEQVIRICDRHFGIGADGVILVQQSPRPECVGYMNYINSDGTFAQMCGNGVRCFAKFLVDNGIACAEDGKLVADTLAGPKPIAYELDDFGKLERASVNMGSPIFDPSLIPIDADANGQSSNGTACVKDLPIGSPWGNFEFTAVSMGNPHAVCFIEDWDALPDELFKDPSSKSLQSFDIDAIGSFYEANPIFPEKANIEFAEVGPHGIDMRVYERGCGETLACGTGACATRVAAAITGRAPNKGDVNLRGGTLCIDWSTEDEVVMAGPAEHTFSGSMEI